MLSLDVRKVFQREIKEFGAKAQRLTDHRREAKEVFQALNLDREIKAYTQLEYRRAPILELAARKRDFSVFGIDSGSTRLMPFENGTTLCANQAIMCAEPPISVGKLPLEAFRTVSIVSHSHRNELGGAHAQRQELGFVHLWRIHISRDFLKRKVDHIVKGLSDCASEGWHTLRMTGELDLKDGLVILDGSIYPIGLYYYLVSEERFDWDINLVEWDEGVKILAQHVKMVESFRQHQIPYVGINKNPETKYMLHFCMSEEQRNWANDRQFIGAVLCDVSKDELGYTNWFVQEGYPSRLVKAEGSIDLFKELRVFKLKLEPHSYHVCFFFVYDPRVRSVLKIETPRAVLDLCDSEELRLWVLSEIARGKGVPNVLRKADSRARITQEERLSLLRCSPVRVDISYDQTRGEPI